MTTTIRRTAVMLAGLTLASGAVLGMANPAAATTAQSSTQQNQTVRGHGWGGWDDDDWEFRGLYNSRWSCERAGRWQTRWDRHDDYVCVRSNQWRRGWDRDNRWGNWGNDWDRWGHRYGVWALYVED
ncbi:hypothetical protein [Cryptosporangium aurantiacum]|uniref:Uncharacterized protein n=1 Tax=Cryptosporangium aurantiacum TaxID=134849 RepID=A0A1M7QRN7_9ACTN|nr:hypothetical protein [Cryptosporangium aurantiacum]SHN34222.1 hypothetical protein SAMN05443668_105235 [Cryptosporangium aurantiacum]